MKIAGLPSSARTRRRWRSAAGFTLLEVLVAVVVLSFGMLGVVALQAAALQANKDARAQSAAARLARELGDMMRGNNTALTGATNPYLVNQVTGPPATTPQNCYTTACTLNPTATAQFEMADWLGRVANELPGAVVTVCADTTPYNAAGVAQWLCTGTGNVLYVKIGWTRQKFNSSAAAASAFDPASRPSIIQALVPG